MGMYPPASSLLVHNLLLSSKRFAGEDGLIGTVYMMDILEEAGSDIARRCYWDFGRWSDLWRAWRPLGSSREASLCLPVRFYTSWCLHATLGVKDLLFLSSHLMLARRLAAGLRDRSPVLHCRICCGGC